MTLDQGISWLALIDRFIMNSLVIRCWQFTVPTSVQETTNKRLNSRAKWLRSVPGASLHATKVPDCTEQPRTSIQVSTLDCVQSWTRWRLIALGFEGPN